MWDFLSKFIFIASASIALGQQSVIVTFGSGNSSINSIEGERYNSILINNESSDQYYTTFSRGLKYTDGTEAPVTLSVCDLHTQYLIEKFEGDASSLAAISSTFEEASIAGYTKASGNGILTIGNLHAGSYTLAVLTAIGTSFSDWCCTYFISADGQTLQNVRVSLIASNSRDASYAPQKTPLDGTDGVMAYTKGTKGTATDWTLMEFSFELKDEFSTLKLRSKQSFGYVAAIKLTAIPEPSAAALSVIAFASLALRRRRK